MGYRHYFYEVDNSMIEKVKNATKDELFAMFPDCMEDEGSKYFSIHDLLRNHGGRQTVYEFGKLYWCDTAARIYSKSTPLFLNPETAEEFSDYKPAIVRQDGVIEAIKIYQEKTKGFLEDLLLEKSKANEFDKRNQLDRLIDHIKYSLREYDGNLSPASIDMECPGIVSSWLIEYSQFEFARILKYTDWGNKSLIFVGW